jgi:hypothetical protein
MSIFYSKSTGGFYISDIHGKNMPTDAISITKEYYAYLLAGQASGKIISSDDSGAPVLIDPPQTTNAELWAIYQKKAKNALTASDTSMLRIYEAVILGETTMQAADVVAFVNWRQEVRAILSTAQPAELPTDLPTMPAYPVGTGTPSTISSTTTTDTTTEAQS